MQKAKKLIEVALPIKEISAESVRDKSIRHGHISTLHLWWADLSRCFLCPWLFGQLGTISRIAVSFGRLFGGQYWDKRSLGHFWTPRYPTDFYHVSALFRD